MPAIQVWVSDGIARAKVPYMEKRGGWHGDKGYGERVDMVSGKVKYGSGGTGWD